MSITERELKVLEYLEGEMSSAEEQAFLAEAAKDPETARLIAEYQQQDRLMHRYFDAQEEVLSRAERPQLERLPVATQTESARHPNRLPLWGTAAAAAALLVAVGVYTTMNRTESGIESVVYTQGVVQGFASKPPAAPTTLARGAIRGDVQRIKTATGARAEVALTRDAGTLEFDGASRATITSTASAHTVEVERGTVILRTGAASDSNYQVRLVTPHVELTARDATVTVSRGVRGSEVGVVAGTAELVLPGGGRKSLSSGDSVSSTGVAPRPLAERVAWSRHRTEHLAALPEDQRTVPSAATVAAPIEVAAVADASAMLSADVFTRSMAMDEPGTIAATLTPANTTQFIPVESYVLFEAPSIPALLESTGQRTLGGLLRDAKTQSFLAEAASNGARGQEDIALMTDRLKELLEDAELQAVLDGLGGAVSIGLGSDGVVLVADVTSDYANVARIVREHAEPVSADRWGDDVRPRIVVENGKLILAFTEELLDPTVAAVRSWLPTGFADKPFVRQVRRDTAGSDMVVALDGRLFVQGVLASQHSDRRSTERFLNRTGLANVSSMVVANSFADETRNQGVRVSFDGERQGMMRWLGAPGPLSGFQFFTPNAHAVMAMRIEQPGAVLDEIFGWFTADDPAMHHPKSDPEVAAIHRIASTLGNELAFGLDNPVLPVPNVKVAIEVLDPEEFHLATVDLMTYYWERRSPDSGGLDVETSEHRGHLIVNIRFPDVAWGLSYAVVDDYVILGPGRPFLASTIDTFVEGHSLDREHAFIAALPAKSGTQVSMLAYAAVNGSVGEAAPYLQQLMAMRGIPIPVSIFTHRPVNGAPAAVYYAVAEGDRIDLFAEGVQAEFKRTGILPSVMSWLGNNQ